MFPQILRRPEVWDALLLLAPDPFLILRDTGIDPAVLAITPMREADEYKRLLHNIKSNAVEKRTSASHIC